MTQDERQEYNRLAARKWYKRHSVKRLRENKDRRKAVVKWFQEYKATLCCSQCPENHPACLDFHHRDAADKIDAVARMIRNGYNIASILTEIKKCDVLCANCHRKHHHEIL